MNFGRGALVLDASVLIGFIHADDAHHEGASQAIADARLRGDTLVLPATVLAETLVREYRAGDAEGHELGDELLALFGPERVVDEAVARTSARLRAGHRSLRFADALVIATGIVDDADVLTCDHRWAAVDPRVRVLELS